MFNARIKAETSRSSKVIRLEQAWASHNRMMLSYLKQWTSYSLASQPLFTCTFAATCRKSKRPCGTQHEEEEEEQSCVVPHRQQRTSRESIRWTSGKCIEKPCTGCTRCSSKGFLEAVRTG